MERRERIKERERKEERKTAEEDRLSLCAEIMLHCINSITPCWIFIALPMYSLYLILSRRSIQHTEYSAIGNYLIRGIIIGVGSELRSELLKRRGHVSVCQ